jgi:hypothetical protein
MTRRTLSEPELLVLPAEGLRDAHIPRRRGLARLGLTVPR